MAFKHRFPVGKKFGSPWLVISVICISVLLAALATLSVYTVLTLNDQQRLLQEQHDELCSLSSAVSQAESELAAKQKELEQQQADASSQLADKDEVIENLQETVSSLKTQIALKQSENAEKQQNLPTRDYPDYSGKKIVALTFDDGPGPYTAQLLDELKQRGVRATFFVLGTRVDAYPDLIKRMEAEGHVVGNHSNEHKKLTKLSEAGVKTEMDACAKKIEKLLGHMPEVMRCPGGSYNSTVLAYGKSAGIPVIQWSVDTRDWESRNVDAILDVAFGKNGIKNGSIVLMHDIYKTTLDATVKMVDRLIAEGYVFVTVPEMIYAKNGSIEAGKLYS